jgi:hypothetical protein
MTLQIEIDPNWAVGDIIKVQGKNHKILKKTTSAVAVERYYFWDRWLDRLVKK